MGCVELFSGGLCLCLLGGGLGLLGHLYGRPERRCCGRRMLGLNIGTSLLGMLGDLYGRLETCSIVVDPS